MHVEQLLDKMQNTLWMWKSKRPQIRFNYFKTGNYMNKYKINFVLYWRAQQQLSKRFDRIAQVELKYLPFRWLVLYYVQQHIGDSNKQAHNSIVYCLEFLPFLHRSRSLVFSRSCSLILFRYVYFASHI